MKGSTVEWVDVVRIYECDSQDLAVAFFRVVTKRFGPEPFESHKIGRIWKVKVAPRFLDVKTGYQQEMKVVVGTVRIKGVQAVFEIAHEGPVIEAHVRVDFRERVEEMLDEVKRIIETESIYRGKAFTINREFMNLGDISMDEIVYNEKVHDELDAHVWTLIRNPDMCRQLGVKFNRKILFEGIHGTGKTITALVTAKLALANGCTFVYVEPTAKIDGGRLEYVLRVADKYPPAVVLLEDIDREQLREFPSALGVIMAAIDGAMSKNNQILVIMTTNHRDKIVAGLSRPGRIDKIISFNEFNRSDIRRLLEKLVPAANRSLSVNWNNVTESCAGYPPVFVREVGIGAKLMAIRKASARGENPIVTEEMLIQVAKGLREQCKMAKSEHVGF